MAKSLIRWDPTSKTITLRLRWIACSAKPSSGPGSVVGHSWSRLLDYISGGFGASYDVFSAHPFRTCRRRLATRYRPNCVPLRQKWTRSSTARWGWYLHRKAVDTQGANLVTRATMIYRRDGLPRIPLTLPASGGRRIASHSPSSAG